MEGKDKTGTMDIPSMFGENVFNDVVTVSYTHLTLPTT